MTNGLSVKILLKACCVSLNDTTGVSNTANLFNPGSPKIFFKVSAFNLFLFRLG